MRKKMILTKAHWYSKKPPYWIFGGSRSLRMNESFIEALEEFEKKIIIAMVTGQGIMTKSTILITSLKTIAGSGARKRSIPPIDETSRHMNP